MADKVAVTFLEHYYVFNAGETAGYDRVKAQELVDSGIAIFREDAEADAPEATPDWTSRDYLNTRTVPQLRAYADDNDIDLTGRALKADIVEGIATWERPATLVPARASDLGEGGQAPVMVPATGEGHDGESPAGIDTPPATITGGETAGGNATPGRDGGPAGAVPGLDQPITNPGANPPAP